jgi:hypothetical protein
MITVLIGTLLLSQMTHQTSRFDLAWRMAVLGLGLGPLQGLYGVAVQNAVPLNRIGVVTSANQFFRQIGSTVGVAIFGTLLSTGLNAKLEAWSVGAGLPPLDLSKLRSLAVEAQGSSSIIDVPEPIRILIANSVTHVFLLSLTVVIIALIATLMIPELPMRERPRTESKDALAADTHS